MNINKWIMSAALLALCVSNTIQGCRLSKLESLYRNDRANIWCELDSLQAKVYRGDRLEEDRFGITAQLYFREVARQREEDEREPARVVPQQLRTIISCE